jgi:hypothetical protein
LIWTSLTFLDRYIFLRRKGVKVVLSRPEFLLILLASALLNPRRAIASANAKPNASGDQRVLPVFFFELCSFHKNLPNNKKRVNQYFRIIPKNLDIFDFI